MMTHLHLSKRLIFANEYMKDHIFELWRKQWRHAVVHNLSSSEIKPERNSNPWPLRYRCSAISTDLLSHLGAGHIDRWCLYNEKSFANLASG